MLQTTEEYDGSTWTGGGNMGTVRRALAGCGTQTAALGFGGYSTGRLTNTEEYDGSSWTGGGNLGTAKDLLAGAGLQTAGLAFGGITQLLIQIPQKNMMDQLGQAGGNMGTARLL
jgi:hypothetical protein